MIRSRLLFTVALGAAFFAGREARTGPTFAQDRPASCASCKEAERAKYADAAKSAESAKYADTANYSDHAKNSDFSRDSMTALKIPSQSQPNTRPEDTPGGCGSAGDAGKLVVNTVFYDSPAKDQVTLWVCAQASPSGGNPSVGAAWRKVRLPVLAPGA
jgi:hypothetical protein